LAAFLQGKEWKPLDAGKMERAVPRNQKTFEKGDSPGKKRRRSMKISDINSTMVHRGIGHRTEKNKNKDTFQNIMNQVLDQQEEKSVESARANAPGAVSNTLPASLVGHIDGKNGSASCEQVMKEVQSALDLADFYSDKLGNRSVSAASLEPLVGHLEEKMNGLRFLKEQGNIDQDLKTIVSELDIAVGSEVARFRRGDYS
jgi:hypothetical protein